MADQYTEEADRVIRELYTELNMEAYKVVLESMIKSLKVDIADLKTEDDPDLDGAINQCESLLRTLEFAEKIA